MAVTERGQMIGRWDGKKGAERRGVSKSRGNLHILW